MFDEIGAGEILDDGWFDQSASGQVWVVTWPDHCTTATRVTGDVTCHGPYVSEAEARSDWPAAV